MKAGKKSKKPAYEPGPNREPGTAGPKADYIEKSLDRWKMRGDGYKRNLST
jgi:hypothetical protein